jgi:hypothetical protein
MECGTCGENARYPYRRYVDGKVSEGCVDDCHSQFMQYDAWHNRPEAWGVRKDAEAYKRTI